MSHAYLDAFHAPAGFVLVSSGHESVQVYAPVDPAALPEAPAPELVLPFRLDREAAEAAVKAWSGHGWLRPRGFVKALCESLGAEFVPGGVLEARLVGTYEVEVARTRWIDETDANGNPRRRAELDWTWKRGELRVLSGPQVLSETDLDVGDLGISGFVPCTPEALGDVELRGACSARCLRKGHELLQSQAVQAAQSEARGDRQRHLLVEVEREEEQWRPAVLPVWVGGFDWGGERWTVEVNGATGEVRGARPVSWRRVYLTLFAALAPGLFTGVCLGLPMLVLAGFGILVWIVAVGMLAVGGAAAVRVYGSAVEGR